MILNQRITLSNLVADNKGTVATNIFITTIEIVLMALIPLFIGFAIDDLIAGQTHALFKLVVVLVALIFVSVGRRLYDTRAYGNIRINVQQQLAKNKAKLPISVLNARIEMGRELVDFLEQNVPEILNAVVQFVVSLIVLYFLNPVLSLAAFISAVAMLLIYILFHRRFYVLNGMHNKQSEQQVTILEMANLGKLKHHFTRLKQFEVKLSDSEAFLYGSVFLVLVAMVVFNLWFSATTMEITAGTIFSIVSYSWEFVEAAIVLPVTLQSMTRLSEITKRINSTE